MERVRGDLPNHLRGGKLQSLRLLHFALCEARFQSSPSYHAEVQGSPLSAETANRVYDLLIEHAPTESEANGWRLHRQLSSTSHLMPAVEEFARRLNRDSALSFSEKKAALRVWIAPFQISDHLVDDLFEKIGKNPISLW